MLGFKKKILSELKRVTWLIPRDILKETLLVILVSIIFLLILGATNLLLQQSFNNLLSN